MLSSLGWLDLRSDPAQRLPYLGRERARCYVPSAARSISSTTGRGREINETWLARSSMVVDL